MTITDQILGVYCRERHDSILIVSVGGSVEFNPNGYLLFSRNDAALQGLKERQDLFNRRHCQLEINAKEGTLDLVADWPGDPTYRQNLGSLPEQLNDEFRQEVDASNHRLTAWVKSW